MRWPTHNNYLSADFFLRCFALRASLMRRIVTCIESRYPDSKPPNTFEEPYVNIARLIHLVTILGRVSPAQLKMGRWTCGTGACVIGHAALDPTFNAEGFVMETSNLLKAKPFREPAYNDGAQHHTGWPASYKFFDLTPVEAHYLFSEDFYATTATPQDVIGRINEVIAKRARGETLTWEDTRNYAVEQTAA